MIVIINDSMEFNRLFLTTISKTMLHSLNDEKDNK